MREAAFALVSTAQLLAFFVMWRATQAVMHRNEQPADSNDVIVVIALLGVVLTMSLLGVTLAVLA